MKNPEFKEKKEQIVAVVGIFFFIILALVARVSSSRTKNLEKQELEPSKTPVLEEATTNKETKVLDSINQKNYRFTYTIKENDQVELIDGKSNQNKMKFTVIGNKREEYAKVSENYLKLSGSSYEIINTEIRPYFPYIQLENLEKILEQSRVETEENIQIFQIDTIDLLDQYTEIEYTGFEDFQDDEVKIYKAENGKISKIEIDYSNYYSYLKNLPTTFKITMEFTDFDMIEELEI